MGDLHRYAVTLSPKGQVATARCFCGWVGKGRAGDGATAEERARSAGEGHLECAPAEDEQLTRKGLLVIDGRGSHRYRLATQDDGTVVAKCACGWKTTFRASATGGGQTAQEMASEYAERHAAHAAKPAFKQKADPAGVPTTFGDNPDHKLAVKPVGANVDIIDATCTCGSWKERLYSAGGKSAVKVAFDAHQKHVVEVTPWSVGLVAVVAGMAAIVVLFFVMIGMFVSNLGSDDTDNSSGYSYTDTGGSNNDSDRCSRTKAWVADNMEGNAKEGVLEGMGDCADW